MSVRRRWQVIVLALAVLAGSTRVHGQGGPFSAQIEAFWRLISTGGRTFQTLKATGATVGTLTVTGSCVGCTTTFPLLAPDATAVAPAYAWANSPGSGFFRHGANQIGISIAGSERMFWSGNQFLCTTDDTCALGSSGGSRFNGINLGPTGNITYNNDIQMRRSAAKTLTIDTDGAAGNLTQINFDAVTATFNSNATFVSLAGGAITISDATESGVVQAVTASGERPAGLLVAGGNGFGGSLRGGTTAGDRTVLNYFDGTQYRSAVEVATVASGFGVLQLMKSGGTITTGAKITNYNAIATAGWGVPAIEGENISSTQTANFTALSYTPPATAGRYEVGAVITTTSATNTGTVQVTVDYVDSQGTTHTADVIPLVDAAGAVATTKTGASKEFHSLPWKISINGAATAIVLKVVVTGSVSYTVSPSVVQVA